MTEKDPKWDEEVEKYTNVLRKFAASTNYTLNPDEKYLRLIVEGLLMNKKKFGYASCPCRVADGKRELDADIICPCVYRDPDLEEYGRCLCGLYVNEEYTSGRKGQGGIPDRRKYQKMERK
ncbi:MAG: ferredoxin:thioredoxin reductase [Thermoplasmata archaeon]|nr:ferredoxin:thioredoxin reductase [Thermoplasmata archaeon]